MADNDDTKARSQYSDHISVVIDGPTTYLSFGVLSKDRKTCMYHTTITLETEKFRGAVEMLGNLFDRFSDHGADAKPETIH